MCKSSKEEVDGYFTMTPLIEEVQAESIEEFVKYSDYTEAPDPLLQAYIKVENRSFVFGELAKQLHVEEKLFDKKYEYGLYKVLAAIGIVIETLGVITKNPMEVWVGVLLPWNEYRDKERFKSRFLKLAKSYKFRSHALKLKVIPESVIVLPEGAGTAAGFMIEKTRSFFKGKKIGIGMFGYQNLTGLVFEDGVLKTGESPKIGMSLFLDWVIERSSGLEREKLLKVINKCIDEIEIDEYGISSNLIEDGQRVFAKSSFPQWDKLKAPKKLSLVSDAILREQEIKDICKILEIVSKQYRARVRNWLATIFPTEDMDCLFISGGAAKFLQQEIEQHCSSYRSVELSSKDFEELDNRDKANEEPTELANKHKYHQGSSSGVYVRLGDVEESIELISDRVLAHKVASSYKITRDIIEKMALDSRLVDNYGSLKRLLDKEKKYQAKQRSARATKAAKASKEARENKALYAQTESLSNSTVAVELGSQIANTSNGKVPVDSMDEPTTSEGVRSNEDVPDETGN